MKTPKYKFIPLLILCIILCGCNKSEKSIPDSADFVLHSILEYPNEDLYTPSTVVISIDEDPEDVDYEKIQDEIRADTEKWDAAIGECFAGDMFASFYQQWERDGILGYAYANDLTVTVEDIKLLSQDDVIWHIQTTIDVVNSNAKTETYDLEWRIIFDKSSPELIQSVELLDDADFLNYEA